MTPAAVFARTLYATYRGQTIPRAAVEELCGVRTRTVLDLVGVTADARTATFPAA